MTPSLIIATGDANGTSLQPDASVFQRASTAYCPPPGEFLTIKDDAKTLLGFEPGGLDALFPRRRLCDYVETQQSGNYPKHPVSYFFLGGLPGSLSQVPPRALYAQPSLDVFEAVVPRCMNRALGSFTVIRSMYWKERGRMLVVARDSHAIASPWVATVPYLSDEECEAWIARG